jgi:hypothetical protein
MSEFRSATTDYAALHKRQEELHGPSWLGGAKNGEIKAPATEAEPEYDPADYYGD